MAVKVPSYDNFSTRPSGGGTPGFSDPGFGRAASIAGEQQQRLGQAVERAADTAVSIKVDALDEVNKVRVADAVNQMRERAMQLTYDPKDGFLNLKGNNALERPDGRALPDEYGGRLDEAIGSISGGLGSEAQRRAFMAQASSFKSSFTGDVQSHMLKEFRNYSQSVADGDFKLSMQEAELNWNNPDKIDAAINGVKDIESGVNFGGIKQSIYQKAKLTGMSASEAQAAMNEAESSVHAKVVQSALVNNNPTYATAYLDKNKANMTASDILRVQGQVNQKMDAHQAITASSQAMKDYSPAFNPTDMDRLTNIVQGMESGGRRFGQDGKPLTSPAGAKGEMQVMDTTNLNPGFGVEPAKDDSLDERKRVGTDYLAAMVKRYGDAPKALAAYNAGPGTVDNAIAAAKKAGNPNDWMNHLKEFQSPASNTETLAYVDKGMKSFLAGAGAAKLPTEAEFTNAAVEKLGPNPRLEAVEATRTQAAAQYKLIGEAHKQRGDAALEVAQQELIANGGNFNLLKPETVSNLSRYAPAKYDDAMKFAKAISSDNVATNMEAYSLAVQRPAELAAMSEPIFQQFLRTNFDKGDQEKIITLRAGYLTGTSDDSPKAINNTLVNSTLDNRLEALGINPNPKKSDTTEMARIGQIQKFVRDEIYAQQQAVGRKLAPKEVETAIDTIFAKSVSIQKTLLGYQELPGLGVKLGQKNFNLLDMTVDDIPKADRKRIEAQFANRTNIPPTDADILEFYRKWKLGDG
jgi:soluble lytic murein transglycosylase